MVEKMTAVWLIILTVMVCSAVPALLIWLTASPASMLLGFEHVMGSMSAVATIH